jgi:hypothetical protein
MSVVTIDNNDDRGSCDYNLEANLMHSDDVIVAMLFRNVSE